MKIFIDIEYTGMEAWDEMIELAIVDINYKVLFYSRFKPKIKTFNPFAYQKHRIKYRDLINCPRFTSLEPKITSLLYNNEVIAYNICNDMITMLRTYSKYRKNLPDSLWLDCAEFFKIKKGIKQQVKLQKACEILNIKFEEEHNALMDALACCAIYRKLHGK